ncbi:MAG: endonuclease III domain-containing protein [Verrucomicrobiia bacterium]
MRAHFGHQHWWPGDTPFEICLGAILTQNTAWSNVEKAIVNLKRARALSPRALHRLSERQIATLIRPSGYFNIKARRLKAFIEFLFAEYGGSMTRMRRDQLTSLREKLLSVNGIGPETADSILLYALGKPIFVVDAYTRRVLVRHRLIKPSATYDEIQALFHSSLHLPRSTFFNDFHAQFVAVGKTYCKSRVALCGRCPLKPLLSLPSGKKKRICNKQIIDFLMMGDYIAAAKLQTLRSRV